MISLVSHTNTSEKTSSVTDTPIPKPLSKQNIPMILCCLVHADRIPGRKDSGLKGFLSENSHIHTHTLHLYLSAVRRWILIGQKEFAITAAVI